MIGFNRRSRKSNVQDMGVRVRSPNTCPSHASHSGRTHMIDYARRRKEEGSLVVARNIQSGKAWLSAEKQQHVAEWVSKHARMCSYAEQHRWGGNLSDSIPDSSLPSSPRNKLNERPTSDRTDFTSSTKSPAWEKSGTEKQSNTDSSELLIKPEIVVVKSGGNYKSLQQHPQRQRPQRQRPPQKLEQWKLLVDKEGNLMLQGHLALNKDMVTGQVLTTQPIEIWERGRVVRTRDKKIFQLMGEIYDPSGDVPPSVKAILHEREAVDWRRVVQLLYLSKGEIRHSVSKNSIISLPKEPAKAHNLRTRKNKQASEGTNPSQTSVQRKQVKRSVSQMSFNLPHAAGKQATEPKSQTATQKHFTKNSSAVVQSSGQATSGKDNEIVSYLKESVPFKVQITDENTSPVMLNEKLSGPLTPLRRSDRFSKQRSCTCCTNCDSSHPQFVKQTASKRKRGSALVECESKQMSVRKLYVRGKQTSQVPDAKYKIIGRPLTRSLTTRSMRSLCKSVDSSDFTSPAKSRPWLWNASTASSPTLTRSYRQSPKFKGKLLSPAKSDPSRTLNSLCKRPHSPRLTQTSTSSSLLSNPKLSDKNQKKKDQKSKAFTKRSQDLRSCKTEQKLEASTARYEDLKASWLAYSKRRKIDSEKEPCREDIDKLDVLVQKSDNTPKKIIEKRKRPFSKLIQEEHVKEEESCRDFQNSYSSSVSDHNSGSVESDSSDSSCGPSASVVFALRKIQEMKTPRTLRERQLQDAQIEQMKKRAFAADEDDPLAELELSFNGVTNEQCDYNRLLKRRRYSKSDSCCTPPTCYIPEEDVNNEDAASSVATPSLLSWEPQRKAIQSYVQRQRTWNSGQRQKVNNGEISMAMSPMPVMSSMNYSIVQIKEKDAVSYVSSFFADEDSDN